MRVLEAATGYQPHRGQLPIHLHPSRLKLVSGGERAGKSRFSAEEPVLYILDNPERDKLIWIVGGVYELAKPEFNYAFEELSKLGLVEKSYLPRLGGRECQGPNYRMITKSSDDVLRLAAEAPDYVLMTEAAQQPLQVYLRLRGRIAEKRGYMVLSGTFEGSLGWYPDYWRKWQHANGDGGISFSMPTWDNTIIFPGGRQDPEIVKLEEAYPPALFQERFGAVPCPPSTLVFPEFDWDKHTIVGLTPDDWGDFWGSVELAIDPGYYAPYAVLAVQRIGDAVFVLDEIYRTNTLGEDMIRIAKDRPWWPFVKGGVIDIGARKHDSNQSQIEVWEELGGLALRSQFVHITDGITRYKSFLQSPGFADVTRTGLKGARIYFDRDNCPHSIAEHGKYKYRDVRDDRPVNEEPIDRDNHAVKALWYYLVDVFGYVPSLSLNLPQYAPRYPRRRRMYA